VIFYEPLPEGDGILVWRILHGARDFEPIGPTTGAIGADGGGFAIREAAS
jgi:hypothetical protein